MKCPLRLFKKDFPNEDSIARTLECLDEDCAWWDKITARCHIVTLSVDLDRIATLLASLDKTMP